MYVPGYPGKVRTTCTHGGKLKIHTVINESLLVYSLHVLQGLQCKHMNMNHEPRGVCVSSVCVCVCVCTGRCGVHVGTVVHTGTHAYSTLLSDYQFNKGASPASSFPSAPIPILLIGLIAVHP